MKKKIQEIKKKIIPVLKKNKVKRAGIFGSYARGKEKKNSDIDILIEIDENISLLGFIRLKNLIQKRLKKQVDLVEYKSIRPFIKKQALKEEVKII